MSAAALPRPGLSQPPETDPCPPITFPLFIPNFLGGARGTGFGSRSGCWGWEGRSRVTPPTPWRWGCRAVHGPGSGDGAVKRTVPELSWTYS